MVQSELVRPLQAERQHEQPKSLFFVRQDKDPCCHPSLESPVAVSSWRARALFLFNQAPCGLIAGGEGFNRATIQQRPFKLPTNRTAGLEAF